MISIPTPNRNPKCPHCQNNSHIHGSYYRKFFHFFQILIVQVPRYRCTNKCCTFSQLPENILPYMRWQLPLLLYFFKVTTHGNLSARQFAIEHNLCYKTVLRLKAKYEKLSQFIAAFKRSCDFFEEKPFVSSWMEVFKKVPWHSLVFAMQIVIYPRRFLHPT